MDPRAFYANKETGRDPERASPMPPLRESPRRAARGPAGGRAGGQDTADPSDRTRHALLSWAEQVETPREHEANAHTARARDVDSERRELVCLGL